MRNHIIIKFLAVLLCAASLLGAVGSGLGIVALTELDLYDKTVDQVREEQIRQEGDALAYAQAMLYACQTLGGCPEDMVFQQYNLYDSDAFLDGLYGYTLTDAEGNTLASKALSAGVSYTTYSFDISGQYMHLVELRTGEETEEEPTEATLPEQTPPAGYAVLANRIPTEGATVAQVTLSSPDSSSGAAGDSLGTVFCNQDGLVILRCPGWELGETDPLVTAIVLSDSNGTVLFEARAEEGVGTLACADGGLVFTSFYPSGPAVVAEQTEAASTEETEAVTEAAETDPTEQTAAEETAGETDSTEEAEDATEEAKASEEADSDTSEKEKKKTDGAEETEADTSETEAAEETQAPEETRADAEETAETTEETAAAAEAETVPENTLPEESLPEETVPAETTPEPELINGKPLNTYQINRFEYYDSETGQNVTARYVYVPMPEMTLTLYTASGALTMDVGLQVMQQVQAVRRYLFPALGICLLLLAVCVVYLSCAAGRKPGTDEVRPGGLNRMPLDLYAGITLVGISGLGIAIAEGGEYLLRQNLSVGCCYMAGMGYGAALLAVGFLFACLAQFKTAGGFWWRNSLFGLCLKLCRWLCRKALVLCGWMEVWAECRGWPLLKRLLGWLWGVVMGLWRRFCRGLGRIVASINRFSQLLPVTWQWLSVGCAMVMCIVLAIVNSSLLGFWLAVLLAFALVVYGAYCFGTLLDTTRNMNRGDLNIKVDDKLMVGAFKDFAEDLNDLAGVAVVAAQKQLKSERMKTELITNVSHDIKTPLTSIINYVDLLQKPHTQEEQEQYLEVLERQSHRLKRLIDDLMDMSKASTGNMTVEITQLDAVESVNQALGEFADKLERACLTPVFRHTEESVAMMADGKLVWRVLSNLLSNVVKYALPGTRVYLDLMRLDGKVVISLKNISRDELNVDAEELMERFVRGDTARNTEGSGLGLNIAKSLMELQKGQLQLLVDGDLFKVTLIFPGV